MNKILLKLACFGSLPLFSAQTNFSEIIDFGNFQSSIHRYYHVFEADAWRLGHYAFNYAPELSPYFLLLKRDYHIDAAIETGTFRGGTTVFFSLLFDEVHTIELAEYFYKDTKYRLEIEDFPNVHCHQGSSEEVLRNILPSLKEKVLLFYLDAHWGAQSPLLAELEEISKTHRDHCVIVIDDFKVPGRDDISYDSYSGGECSYTYIKSSLDKIFSSHVIHYLIPKNISCRAKLVVLPAEWAKKVALRGGIH